MQSGIAYRLEVLAVLALRIGGKEFLSSHIPTPRAQARLSSNRTIKEYRHNLEEFVTIWPTPTSRDWRSGKGARERPGHSQQIPEMIGGQLNPQWVEWLMGFPAGWTDLED
tara:strand:+ start:173 stop:505 length:333 start_codon:yes stop_codon:yes gene_type:complete